MGVGGQPHALAASTPRKDLVPIVQEARWAPGLVWTGAENLAPTGIRSPHHPARSQSLYHQRYPAHTYVCMVSILKNKALPKVPDRPHPAVREATPDP